jgi:hypothetical protein
MLGLRGLQESLLVNQQAAKGNCLGKMLAKQVGAVYQPVAAAAAAAASARAEYRAVGECRCSSGVKKEKSVSMDEREITHVEMGSKSCLPGRIQKGTKVD